jgi:hypothetical protein
MSRFNDSDYDEWFPNQGAMWWANVARALKGRKGQQALRELREAMLGLPQRRLISSRLATEEGEVCAVGALALKRRVDRGERREEVLKEMADLIVLDEDGWDPGGDGDLRTAESGVKVGLTFSLAWHLGQINDDFCEETPEQRFERVLAWVEKQLIPVTA